MVGERRAPGFLELDKLGRGFWRMAIDGYGEDVAEGDMGAGGGMGDNRSM